jgi:GNAT superfamily N-acetyltransferase
LRSPDHPQVRPAVVADAEAVARLAGQLGYPTTAQEARDRLPALLADPDRALLVATAADGAVIGWVHGTIVRLIEAPPLVEVWGLVVAEGARGEGIGRLLMSALEAWARERGLGEVRLRSNVVRERGHRFYLGLGYELVKTQKVFRKALGGAGEGRGEG